jgi:hypothetical protein
VCGQVTRISRKLDALLAILRKAASSAIEVDWFLNKYEFNYLGRVVAEHGPEDVDAAPGKGDERLFV